MGAAGGQGEGSTPGAEGLLDVPGALPATELFFEATQRKLYAAQMDSGTLWSIDVDAVVPPLEPDGRIISFG